MATVVVDESNAPASDVTFEPGAVLSVAVKLVPVEVEPESEKVRLAPRNAV